MTNGHADLPDSTAVRVALWRAMHVEVAAAPHVLDDIIGLQLAAPDDDWRERPDMHPIGTRGFRAAIVARARFIEDLVAEQAEQAEAGFGVPDWLRLVPIDFESGESWWDGLSAAGFDHGRAAVVASTGVSMYLSKDTTSATLRQLTALAPDAGFRDVAHISSRLLVDRYFAGRADGLRPSSGEELILART